VVTYTSAPRGTGCSPWLAAFFVSFLPPTNALLHGITCWSPRRISTSSPADLGVDVRWIRSPSHCPAGAGRRRYAPRGLTAWRLAELMDWATQKRRCTPRPPHWLSPRTGGSPPAECSGYGVLRPSPQSPAPSSRGVRAQRSCSQAAHQHRDGPRRASGLLRFPDAEQLSLL
jgi:hypothetical protein